MSRIGQQAIAIPSGIKVQFTDGVISVQGGKGAELSFAPHPNMNVEIDETAKQIRVSRPNDERLNRSLHGLTRTLIANMIEGITKGFERKLKIEGLGFNGRLDGKTIVLSLGYANQIRLTPPEGVTVEVDKDGVNITVKGMDKQKVGQFAANIRAARKPEPYQGKGIRYLEETVRRKEGKAFKK